VYSLALWLNILSNCSCIFVIYYILPLSTT
jgi:hypothetical protein